MDFPDSSTETLFARPSHGPARTKKKYLEDSISNENQDINILLFLVVPI